jgi:hypothetical protein
MVSIPLLDEFARQNLKYLFGTVMPVFAMPVAHRGQETMLLPHP